MSSIAPVGFFSETIESFTERCSSKQMFLTFSKISLQNTCVRVSFLIKLIKNRVQHRFFPEKFAKFLWTPFYRTTPVAASVFCKDFVDMGILTLILEEPMWLQLIYFLKTISFWFVECLFSIDGTLTSANYFRVSQNLLCFLYHLNQSLWRIQRMA